MFPMILMIKVVILAFHLTLLYNGNRIKLPQEKLKLRLKKSVMSSSLLLVLQQK
jgi:hypothetical protein